MLINKKKHEEQDSMIQEQKPELADQKERKCRRYSSCWRTLYLHFVQYASLCFWNMYQADEYKMK